MKRTDKFRPSVIDPTKFTYVSMYYLGSSDEVWESLCGEMDDQFEVQAAHEAAHPGFTHAGHGWKGRCDCCGARHLFGAVFHTTESNTYISIGNTCAGKMNLGNPVAFKRFREQVNTWKIHQERVAKARTYLATVNLTAMLDMYMDKANVSREFPEVTLRDMCSKVIGWGNELSEKQQAFAHKLLKQIADRPALLAAKELEDANRKPVPVTDKRLTIVGKVISAKYDQGGWVDGQSFPRPESIKIVIVHADGWKVWGSAPADIYGFVGYHPYVEGQPVKHRSMEDAARDLVGKTVQLDARVTPSDKDCKFGFFKRPTKGKVVDEAVKPNQQMELVA